MTDGKATIADVHTLVGQVVSDRYEVQKHLGDGSMGIVFLAEHTHMKKKVALKVMRPELLDNAEAVERFQREAQAAAHIEHPNVCAATDFGRLDDDRFFLVMEYLQGHSLADVLDSERRLEPERAVALTRQIAAGLQRAHELGIVHRDLKPDNIILIDREGNPDFVKITDFGVARVEVVDEQKLTRAGTTMGTPVYMSPEQAVAKRADERSDLYTLGVMLFEMLTGEVPFYSESLAVILSKHAQEEPPHMHEVAPDAMVPRDLVAIVERLLQKSPGDRFQSAKELDDALAAADLTPWVPELGGATSSSASSASSPSDASAPSAPSAVSDAEDSSSLSGSDIFSSAEDVETPPAPLRTERDFPAPRKPATFSDMAERFFEYPAWMRYGAILGVLLVLATPVVLLGVHFLSSGKASDDGGPMTFSADEAQPAGLDAERKSFLDDNDLSGKYEKAQPADQLAMLQPLAADNSDNPHFQYLVARAAMAAEHPDDAMGHYAKAIKLDPRYASEGALVDDVTRRFAAKSDSDAKAATPVVMELLSSKSNGATVTSLADSAVNGSWRARRRARRALEKSGAWKSLAKWQQDSIELRNTGKNCEQIRRLVKKVADDGDPRALPVLEKTSHRPTTGCGFLKRGDCYACMRDDVRKAIHKLEKLQDGSTPP